MCAGITGPSGSGQSPIGPTEGPGGPSEIEKKDVSQGDQEKMEFAMKDKDAQSSQEKGKVFEKEGTFHKAIKDKGADKGEIFGVKGKPEGKGTIKEGKGAVEESKDGVKEGKGAIEGWKGGVEEGESKGKVEESKGSLVKDQVVEDAIAKAGGQVKSLSEGSEKTKEKKAKDDTTGLALGQQVASTGPLGQAAQMSEPKPVSSTSRLQEVADLASKMVDKMLVNDAKLSAGKEVRMNFGDANPNLKGVEVIIKKDGDSLKISFQAMTQEASNYINQNKDSLNTTLLTQVKDVNNINIDVQKPSADTGGQQDRRSKGEYIPEPPPEEPKR